MNELVWEGLIEILREGQPSLKASAHLWRRDDISGSDWGGQLELPVVFRRLLPADEYQVRLPSGTEARVRVAAGPSTTTMTFPTLTGIGHPPFGAPVSTSAAPTEADDDTDEPVATPATPARRAAEATRTSRERGARTEAPPRAHRTAAAAPPSAAAAVSAPEPVAPPEPAPQPEAPPAPGARAPQASDPEPVAPPEAARTAEVPRLEDAPGPEPTRAAPRRTPARTRSERPAVALVSRVEPQRGTDMEESVEQTEALARAFLAAIEARQAIRTLVLPGFQGRAIGAATLDVEHVATTLEGALRAPNASTEWVEPLRQHLTLLAWFASLAAPDEQAEVAAAGQSVQTLIHNIEGFLAIGADNLSETLAA